MTPLRLDEVLEVSRVDHISMYHRHVAGFTPPILRARVTSLFDTHVNPGRVFARVRLLNGPLAGEYFTVADNHPVGLIVELDPE